MRERADRDRRQGNRTGEGGDGEGVVDCVDGEVRGGDGSVGGWG